MSDRNAIEHPDPAVLTGGTLANRPGDDGTPGVTIVLADDHALVRSALRLVLETEPGFEVVAEAGDVHTALRKVRGFKPDVLVLDLNMPGGSSLEAIPTLLEASPGTAIVVLTMQDEPELARAALRAGALAFVLKQASDSELEGAIHAVLGGHMYLSPQLGARIATAPGFGSATPDRLSGHELELLRLLALGYTNAEIADTLFLSVRTVEAHRSQIERKTGRRSRAELVEYALEYGLVGPKP